MSLCVMNSFCHFLLLKYRLQATNSRRMVSWNKRRQADGEYADKVVISLTTYLYSMTSTLGKRISASVSLTLGVNLLIELIQHKLLRHFTYNHTKIKIYCCGRQSHLVKPELHDMTYHITFLKWLRKEVKIQKVIILKMFLFGWNDKFWCTFSGNIILQVHHIRWCRMSLWCYRITTCGSLEQIELTLEQKSHQ